MMTDIMPIMRTYEHVWSMEVELGGYEFSLVDASDQSRSGDDGVKVWE